MVVVLPAPFGPSRPKSSPRPTSKLIPRSASTSLRLRRKMPVRERYVRASSVTTIADTAVEPISCSFRPGPPPGRKGRRQATIVSGVPAGVSRFSTSAAALDMRTQPWDTRLPRSCGMEVPWRPTTPPPGHSESFE